MSCKFTFPYTKISSLDLIIKHEQLNLNYSIKHIFTQKFIFVNTILGTVNPRLLFLSNHHSSVHFVNPNFTAISGLIHIKASFIAQICTMNNPKSPWTVTDYPHGFLKFHTSVPRFGTDQTAPQGVIQLKHQQST